MRKIWLGWVAAACLACAFLCMAHVAPYAQVGHIAMASIDPASAIDGRGLAELDRANVVDSSTRVAQVGQIATVPNKQPPPAGGGGFSLTAQGSGGTGTTGTTLGYGTLSYGPACNAVIAVVFWYNTATTDTISSLTIGGNATTAVGSIANSGANGGNSIAIRQWSSPSGSSGAVSVTYSASTTYNSNVTLYCLVSGNTTVSNTNAVAGGACNDIGSPITGSVTVPASGTAITASATVSGSVITWTNATADSVYTGGGVQNAWGHTTATGSVNITATPAAGDSCALLLASWGP